MWPNPQETADLATFTEEILNGKLHFLWNAWTEVNAGFIQSSILGPWLFFIYKNHSADGLYLNVKLFAHDTSLFYVVHDIHSTTNDLKTINGWSFQRVLILI